MDVEDDGRLKVFLSHSNKPKDYDLANQIISDLEKREIKIIGQWNMDKGSFVMQAITKLIENVDKTLIVLSENSLDSPWCSFELLVSLEKSQRTNQLGVVLLLIDLEEEQVWFKFIIIDSLVRLSGPAVKIKNLLWFVKSLFESS